MNLSINVRRWRQTRLLYATAATALFKATSWCSSFNRRNRFVTHNCITNHICRTSKDTDSRLSWTRGSLEGTSKYVWNSKQVVWHFCSICGAIICWTGLGSIGMNVRCLDDIPQFVPESTNVKNFNGATQMPGESPAKLLASGVCLRWITYVEFRKLTSLE